MDDAGLALVASLRGPELAADDPRHDGPLVSIVVVTRDGLHHLRRLFAGLEDTTRYRRFEVLVVDNDSHDDSREWLAGRAHGFDVRLFANDHNATFSAANNQVLDQVRGDLTLVLNNDIEPMHPDWLTRLVDELVGDPHLAAVGPLLVYPPRPVPEKGSYARPDLTVQHAGVAFVIDEGRVRARNVDAGTDPRVPGQRRTRDVAALTAACLLARTRDLRELGGFDEGYAYGSEDWDLCLRLGERGALRLVGRAVLFHHEFGTQKTVDITKRTAWQRSNHAHFNATWGPRLWRQVVLERLGDEVALSMPGAPRVVVANDLPGRDRFVAGFTALGWTIGDEKRRPADLVLFDGDRAPAGESGDLSALHRGAVAVALSGGSPDPAAVDLADLVAVPLHVPVETDVAPSVPTAAMPRGGSRADVAAVPGAPGAARQALDLVVAVRGQAARPRIAVRTCVPDHDRAPLWGDTHFAASFRAALARRGLASAVHILPEWDDPQAHTFDVVVHLRGLQPYEPRPGATNVLWVISHADRVSGDEMDAYDLVLVASRPFASILADRTSTPVEVMLQATDVHRFHPAPHRPRQASGGVVVVQNARWPTRRAPRWLRELGVDFSLYGSNWEGSPEARHLVATWIPNDELCEVYAQADVVVADQWGHMAREGFVANRLFDVAASGGFVVSDDGPGVREVFGELVPTYSSRAELRDVLDRCLADPGERDRLAHRAMKLVRREHSFGARADRLLELLGIA